MVGDNDLALGMFVESVSHSRFWPQTAIFVIEDDAQNGPDHVDAHRSIAFVISPYTKRRTRDSTMYSTSSMLRTIELILGLQPMSQFDLASMPMFKSFQATPDLRPYQALPGNYQSVVISGTCVYPVDDSSETGNARVSVTVHSYDDFGQVTNSKEYFGTVSLGVATYCDRTTRLDPSSLKLVLDDYMQYDTPTAVDSQQYVPVGAGSGHYSLTTGHETLSYAEPQEANLFGSLGTSTPPRISCGTRARGTIMVA
jgi:hypothetical protein